MNQSFWESAILEPLRRFTDQALTFLLNNVLAMLLVLLVGMVVALAARALVGLALRLLRFDRFCEHHGLTAAMRVAGIRRSPSAAGARLVYWLVFLVFVILSVAALNVAPLNEMVSRFLLFVPQAIAAVLVLGLGYLLASFLQRATLLAAVNAGLPRARVLGSAVQIMVLVFAAAVAFEQVGIGRDVVLATFTVAFGSLGLAAALAFGHAARDLARTILERQLTPPEPGGPGELTHL